MAPNITTFSIVIGVIVTVLEVYVVGHFTAFLRREKRSAWWYRAAWITSAVMIGVYWYVVYQRHFFRMGGQEVFLFGLVCFWSLPKLFIALVLLLRDLKNLLRLLVRHVRAVWMRWSSSKTPELSQPLNRQDHVPNSNAETNAAERRAFLARASWTFAAVPFVIVGKGIWHTLYDFRVYNEEIRLPNLPKALDGFRIVQISDIHAGSFPDHKPFQEVRRIISTLRPDAVVITGDFVNTLPDELNTVANELVALCDSYPVYASLGNHDHYHTNVQHRKLVTGLREMGVDLLINENRRVGSGSNTVVLAGTDNTGFKQEFAQLGKALEGTRSDDAIVLLAHDPTFWDKEVVGGNVGLMLAGHTHGGQFGVQFGGFEWSPANMVYKQCAGRYSRGQQTLYVNRGIGTVGPPMRLGIPPEITVITLRS